MRVNTKIRYGLRTMVEIANAPNMEGILQKDIAKNQNISLKYLDSIISSLKLKGLIVNTKGRGSGYTLTREPKDITMLDIYTAFEQITIIECITNKGFCERASQICKTRSYWGEFRAEFIDILQKKTLAKIIEETHFECNDLI